MNMFILDRDPVLAAQYQYDKHVTKMTLELAQLLCTCHRTVDGTHGIRLSATNRKLQYWQHPDTKLDAVLYKPTHFNHPCSVWLRESRANYDWAFRHFEALSDEYTHRYGKTHLSWTKLSDILRVIPSNLPDVPQTEFANATDDAYRKLDVVTAYQKYYIKEKARLRAYTNRDEPDFLNK